MSNQQAEWSNVTRSLINIFAVKDDFTLLRMAHDVRPDSPYYCQVSTSVLSYLQNTDVPKEDSFDRYTVYLDEKTYFDCLMRFGK